MNARLLNPSNYFSPADFEGDITAKILEVRLEDVEDEAKGKKRKGSILLEGHEKPWLSNVTNTKCLVAMFGDETDRWKGKRVTLYAERVMAFGEWTLGVRLRGSPDIAQPVSVRIKLRKKKEQVVTMQPSGPRPNGNGTAKPSPPQPSTPYAAMWKSYRASGLTDEAQFKDLIRQSTGKSKGSELTAADVLKFDTMLAALTSPAGMDAEPPPPSDADLPF